MRFIAALGTILLVLACWMAPAAAADQSVSGALTEVLHNKGVIDDATYNDLKDAQAAGGDKALNEKLVDVLHNKGILDDATYQSLSAQAKAAPAPVATAPQASAATQKPAADRPLDKALTAVEEGFAKLGGDTVKLKIGTWTQLGYVYDSAGSNAGSLPNLSGTASALNADSSNQFYIRFARLYFNGTLADKVGFRVMVDGTGSPPLRDAFVWFDYIPYTRVTIGQFLTPFGDETWRAPFELPQINYSLAAQAMQFTNFRDIGVMVSGKYITKGAWPVGGGFATAVINGNGINRSDDNDHKDWIGRAWVNPFVPGLSVGGSWYLGKQNFARTVVIPGDPLAVPPIPDVTRRFTDKRDWQRWTAFLDYEPTFAKGLALRGEYLFQRKFLTSGFQAGIDSSKAAAAFAGLADKYYHSDGWYVSALYRVNGLTGPMKYFNDFEPTLRYEEFDEDMSRGDNERTRWTFGLNYWLNKYARLLANYEVIHADGGLKGASATQFSNYSIENFGHQVFTTNVQIWF